MKISIKRKGKHQYIAILLLSGYVWLLITGLFAGAMSLGGYVYDAMVHSFFLGFAFSMIFAHAPIIFPAIIKKNYELYSGTLYIWVVGFHLSLLCRIVGDNLTLEILRLIGGMGSAIFIVGFFGNILVNVKKAGKHQ